ncbi:MAG: M48 family metalloprotease [Planctomycetota bacterium]|nr:M48 family metalloprotease [Planctomycetota bacterium]
MLPDLTVFIALLFGLGALAAPAAEPGQAAIGTLLSIATTVWLIKSAGKRAAQAAQAGETALAEAGRRWTSTWALVGWLSALYFFQWGGFVAAVVPRELWMLPFLVLFLPAAVLFLVAWGERGRVERAAFEHAGKPLPIASKHPVRAGVRRNGIALLPILIIYGVIEAIWVAGALGVEPLRVAAQWFEVMPLLSFAMVFGILLLALPFIPWIINRVLGGQSFPEGRLRRVLERGAERIRLKYNDIVLWRTNNNIVNAMVVGFTPGTRRIFLTDGLINALSEDEIMAVFFHEAGHAKRWHLPLLLLLFFSVGLVFQAFEVPLMSIGIPPMILFLLHIAVVWFGVLGFVSRRFEREADLYGAEHASILTPEAPAVDLPGLDRPIPRGAALMIRALERVRQVSGKGASHRHGTIDERMAYIAAHATNPSVREAWHRNRRNLLLGIAALFVVGLAFTITQYPNEVAVARASLRLEEGAKAYDKALTLTKEESRAAAKPVWESAFDDFVSTAAYVEDSNDPRARQIWILSRWNAGDTALHGLHDAERAKPYFEDVLKAAKEGRGLGGSARSFAFKAHIELGRIVAWMGGDRAEAENHLRAASADPLLKRPRDDLSAEEQAERDYRRDRVRLLEFTIDARLGGEPGMKTARPRLKNLTGSSRKGVEWDELRDDATIELERIDELLPKPTKPAEPAKDE